MRISHPILLIPALIAAQRLQAQMPEETPALVVQSPVVEASSPDSRLRQLESIYQQQLRARHIPLLADYLRDLQQTVAGPNETAALQAEIKRVQDLISAGGLIDLGAAASELNPSTANAAAPEVPSQGKQRRVSLTLTPSFAQSILPQPSGSASPVAATIGQMNWRIGHLSAGRYDFVLHFANLAPDAAVPVRVEFAGQTVEITISTTQATKDAQTYRLLRIGQMKLEKDISGAVLTLTALSPEMPGLLVRHLVIAPAKE